MSETDSVSSKGSADYYREKMLKFKAQKEKYKEGVKQLNEIIAQKDEDIKKLNEKLATPALKCLRQKGDGNMVIILDISNDIPKGGMLNFPGIYVEKVRFSRNFV